MYVCHFLYAVFDIINYKIPGLEYRNRGWKWWKIKGRRGVESNREKRSIEFLSSNRPQNVWRQTKIQLYDGVANKNERRKKKGQYSKVHISKRAVLRNIAKSENDLRTGRKYDKLSSKERHVCLHKTFNISKIFGNCCTIHFCIAFFRSRFQNHTSVVNKSVSWFCYKW